MTSKTISTSLDLWQRLTAKKAELNLGSLEAVIEHLITKPEVIKTTINDVEISPTIFEKMEKKKQELGLSSIAGILTHLLDNQKDEFQDEDSSLD